MKPSTLFWCATLVGACANVSAPTDQQQVQLTAARQLLASSPGDALDAAERLLHDDPDLRAARLLAGECSLRLAHEGASRAQLYLQSARDQFERGLAHVAEDEEPTARLLLAQCLQELGDFTAASTSATAATAGFQKQKGLAARHQAAAAHLCAGDCDYRLFATARQEEVAKPDNNDGMRVKPEDGTARLALRAGSHYQAARADYPAEASIGLARLNQYLGQDEAVLAEIERGLHDAPEATPLHDEFIRWMSSGGQLDALVGAYARFVREQPSLPILRWHQGRAVYTRAHSLRTAGNYQGAITGFAQARDAFGQYLSMMPAHRDTTAQWLAACDLSIANAAAEMGDFDTASARLFSAVDACPLTVQYTDGQPALWDDCSSHFLATAFHVHRGLADSGKDALARTLAFDRALLEHCPDRFGFAYNNAALTARDLGVQKAAAGDAAAAKQLWEQSYAWYEKAVALTPDDARIANDCALMLVYHLDRDLPRARALFDRAIELGKAQLAALPAEAARQEREAIEESVGDALQNIAVMMRKAGRPFAECAPFCEQSVRYFPHQRREAAAMLRAAGAADATQQGGAAEAMAKIADAVKAKTDAGDYDAALGLLDGIAKACRDHAPFHLRRGELTLALAKQAREQNRKGVDLFFQDAVVALKRAVELDGEAVAPRQLLGEAQYEAGDLGGAVETTSTLLLHLQSLGSAAPEQHVAAHLLRANAAARAYQQKKQADQDDKDLLTAARASFRSLADQQKLDATMLQLWSVTEQWAGAPAEAVNVYLRASEHAPDDLGLLDAVVNVASQQGQLPLAIQGLDKRADAGGIWYLAKARYLLADVLRGSKDMAGAQKTLDAAAKDFAASMAKNAAYQDSCETWSAMCYGKKGNIAFWSNDFANAEAWLLEAAKRRPDQIGADLGLTETTKLGIQRLADKFVQAKDLGPAERIYRAAAAAAANDVDFHNNAGFFARDYGVELERDGKAKEAAAMFEQSYKAYSRAVELDPASVNLRNDCALILVYHLDREWEHSKELLDSAIADGEKRLRDNPPDDPNDKEALDMAVGDAYENLALWHLKHDKDAAAAKAAAEQSQKHFPGMRRPGARKHLQDAERLLNGK